MASTWIMTAVSMASALLSFFTQTALMIVILAVVRKHRPDAWGVLAIAAGMEFAAMVIGISSTLLGPALMAGSSGGTESYIRFLTAFHAATTLIAAIGRVLMILGIVKLARPDPAPLGYDTGRGMA